MMELRLVCDNNKCPYDGGKPYIIDFTAEAVLDAKNVAAIFCPHCNHEMRSVESKIEWMEKPAA